MELALKNVRRAAQIGPKPELDRRHNLHGHARPFRSGNRC